ncbi:hypothetical protein OAN307_c12370 [Octadecabacter antarcticus 307]|uniref:Uncharacterized protein n=1 Tax=Octadecabacter antarcticus 307 TaxID=391626 RepID=M9R3Z6_9RHOB|nr:hypothetical protein OAN307_c12370 [Octadecabacter antarcticus 307]
MFAALADQARRAILQPRTDRDVGVMDICGPYHTSPPTQASDVSPVARRIWRD